MKTILSILLVFVSMQLFAQVGISTETPDPSTELHIVSPNNNTGLLIPALDSTSIDAIISPTYSLLVYNTDKNKFMYNSGTPASPIWTFVGDVPAVTDVSAITTANAGDIRFNRADSKMYFWNGTAWKEIYTTNIP